ncbi:MAG: hypothetical protein M0C28_25420 [Candidatus Moduliflexus flocculans]|nr:hypothetical protein [Candidatus Moduliflexus flocculans]
MFLKHFREDVMPPTVRDGIPFVDEQPDLHVPGPPGRRTRQMGPDLRPGARPGSNTATRPTRPWWGPMKDPVKEIGDRILAATPNTEMLIWVDFPVRDVFPLRPGQARPRPSEEIARQGPAPRNSCRLSQLRPSVAERTPFFRSIVPKSGIASFWSPIVYRTSRWIERPS